MPLSSKKMTVSSSKTHQRRTDEARKRLDQKLHAEHRVFMEDLKQERSKRFQQDTASAIVIQRYTRGLAVRMKRDPKKYASLRASLVIHYTKEEMSELVAKAIARCSVSLDG